LKKVLLIVSLIYFTTSLFAKDDIIESQPEILFQYDKLKEIQENFIIENVISVEKK
jgi:hypothetical protein